MGRELEKLHIDLKDTRIRIRFAGLFDTVASHGLMKSNDVKSLGLTAVKKAKRTLHLVAADEHRYFFPLVNSKSAGHMEKYLPGVHSDIGGSYVDNAPEHKKGLAVGFSAVVESKYRTLIREGWYKKEQLKVVTPALEKRWYDPVGSVLSVVEDEMLQHLTGDKKSIPVAYSYIPLHIMCEYAMQKGIWIKFLKDDLNKNYHFNEHQKLKSIKERLYKTVFDNAPEMKFYTREELEKEIDAIRPGGPKKERYSAIVEWMLDKLDELEPEAGKPIEL